MVKRHCARSAPWLAYAVVNEANIRDASLLTELLRGILFCCSKLRPSDLPDPDYPRVVQASKEAFNFLEQVTRVTEADEQTFVIALAAFAQWNSVFAFLRSSDKLGQYFDVYDFLLTTESRNARVLEGLAQHFLELRTHARPVFLRLLDALLAAHSPALATLTWQLALSDKARALEGKAFFDFVPIPALCNFLEAFVSNQDEGACAQLLRRVRAHSGAFNKLVEIVPLPTLDGFFALAMESNTGVMEAAVELAESTPAPTFQSLSQVSLVSFLAKLQRNVKFELFERMTALLIKLRVDCSCDLLLAVLRGYLVLASDYDALRVYEKLVFSKRPETPEIRALTLLGMWRDNRQQEFLDSLPSILPGDYAHISLVFSHILRKVLESEQWLLALALVRRLVLIGDAAGLEDIRRLCLSSAAAPADLRPLFLKAAIDLALRVDPQAVGALIADVVSTFANKPMDHSIFMAIFEACCSNSAFCASLIQSSPVSAKSTVPCPWQMKCAYGLCCANHHISGSNGFVQCDHVLVFSDIIQALLQRAAYVEAVSVYSWLNSRVILPSTYQREFASRACAPAAIALLPLVVEAQLSSPTSQTVVGALGALAVLGAKRVAEDDVEKERLCLQLVDLINPWRPDFDLLEEDWRILRGVFLAPGVPESSLPASTSLFSASKLELVFNQLVTSEVGRKVILCYAHRLCRTKASGRSELVALAWAVLQNAQRLDEALLVCGYLRAQQLQLPVGLVSQLFRALLAAQRHYEDVERLFFQFLQSEPDRIVVRGDKWMLNMRTNPRYLLALTVVWCLRRLKGSADHNGQTEVVIDMSRYASQPGDSNDLRKVMIEVLAKHMSPPIKFAEKVTGERRVILPSAPLHEYLQSNRVFFAVDPSAPAGTVFCAPPPPPPRPVGGASSVPASAHAHQPPPPPPPRRGMPSQASEASPFSQTLLPPPPPPPYFDSLSGFFASDTQTSSEPASFSASSLSEEQISLSTFLSPQEEVRSDSQAGLQEMNRRVSRERIATMVCDRLKEYKKSRHLSKEEFSRIARKLTHEFMETSSGQAGLLYSSAVGDAIQAFIAAFFAAQPPPDPAE
eukprot:m.852812 g.852812  ORF g.852812 m.852812 type:complete len:1082 (+) comp59605_c0_seq2:1587-4832(+)